jgi:hypothetical protein
MNLKITSEIKTSTGISVTNAIAVLGTYPTMNQAGGLDVPCDINAYASMDLKNEGADKIFPVVDGTFNKVTSCTVILTPQQAAAAGLPLTIYQEVASKLATDYGWTVTVEM